MSPTKRFTRRALSDSLASLFALCLEQSVLGQAAVEVAKFGSSDEERSNIEIARKSCASWRTKDVDEMVAVLGDNCSFRMNQGRSPIVGKEKVVETLREFLGKSAFELKVIKTALGPIVLTQREDSIKPSDGTAPRRINIAAGCSS
jgi:limonene-1,2-epoxide hydrolase